MDRHIMQAPQFKMHFFILFICSASLAAGDNSTMEDTSALTSTEFHHETETGLSWGEWTSWSKWSPCSRSCGGGLSRQQRRCKRKPCKGKSSVKFKICNNQACEGGVDFRADQCSEFDTVPYSGQLLKWYPHIDPARPCSLICRGVPSGSSTLSSLSASKSVVQDVLRNKLDLDNDNESEDSLAELDTDDTIVVQLADKVKDGTKCQADGLDVCIGGTCLVVGCDMKVGSGKTKDACGVCGGNGSSCQSRYSWTLQSISACSQSCSGGYKMAVAVCKSWQDDSAVDEDNCNSDEKPTKTLLPCNMHPCPTRWITGEWSKCSTSCGGGSRTRLVFCTEKNENETSKLPDYRCASSHKPKSQESCNTFSCPMWETDPWSECSTTCGTGIRTRGVECRDGNGDFATDCDPLERPADKQECKSNVACSTYSKEVSRPLQTYPAPPVPEKLIDQQVPSQSTFIADEWSPCSATCGEGIRHREVHCKIFLEFSRTIAKLPDRQCAGPKPPETEKCMIRSCGLMENSLSYRIDTAGDSGYEQESNLMDSYRSSGTSSAGDYDRDIKVAPGNSGQTTYSWKEGGYSACTASCLGGVQDLIIKCVRDDTGKTVTPLLCSKETKPESRIRTCNDHACTPRWNYSEFSECNHPCGIGIQTRDVTCIHEVARGPGNTVVVPNHMCQTQPPVDRQHCNVWDCPPKWELADWDKCSKSCGGGVKRREVYCQQVMAQGHKQIRPDRECQGNKPSIEKPCNVKPCSEMMGHTSQALIFSHNTTFNQHDPSQKVDLKIGGTATVFQGIDVVKIRCPVVKKFSKAQIIWTKDQAELHKSKKYKISKKGALKITDIGYTDAGVYACIAGQSHSELRLIVKHRTGEQMSSEEILRSRNTIPRRQDMNSDPGSASSGENLQIDHAAPAYQGAFSFGNDDLSHESRPEIPSAERPTKKPRRKRPKPSPATSDALPSGEYSVTSIHQPGYHESVESTTSSGASQLTPQFSKLISTLKSYWPFQSASSGSRRGHRTAPDLARDEDMKKSPNSVEKTDSRYDDTENNFDLFQRNTVLSDNTFGPDEERIFIDVDPFELEPAVIPLDSWESPKKSTESIRLTSTTEEPGDYLEETLKNAKKRHKNGTSKYTRNHRGSLDSRLKRRKSTTPPPSTQAPKIDVFFLDSQATDDIIQPINNPEENSIKQENMTTTAETTEAPTNPTTNEPTEKNLAEEDEKAFEGSEMEQVEDSFEQELSKQKSHKNESTSETSPTYQVSSNENAREIDSGSADRGALEDLSTEDSAGVTELAKTAENPRQNHSEATNSSNETRDSVEHTSASNQNDLVFEWVTTDWSKCSQTCGGGGFQMRGAQCTVRSTKASTNNTRVSSRSVIGASLCEDAGYPVPEKVRACGTGRCPQWHANEWTPCQSSRCFNWKTAMQRREVSCRLTEELANGTLNVLVLDPSKCDDGIKPPQRQECYNDACKGVWRVGEWSECTAACDEEGRKYRILQCVWFGTKKPAGNACRDIPRPSVMKICKGSSCLRITGECEDHSPFCSKVKMINMCRVPLYQKQCCKSCH